MKPYAEKAFTSQKTTQPLDLVRGCLEKTVYIKLFENREIIGTLNGFDQHLNMVLSKVTERVSSSGNVRKIDMVFVRGDSVILVSPDQIKL